MAVGGLTEGNSHAEGGIPMVVKSTGQKIEVEGGEGILNKYSMSNKKKFKFEGEMLTTCQIASRLNQKKGGGVKFDCDDVEGKKYLFDKGGSVSASINEDVQKISVHPDFYFQAENYVSEQGGKILHTDKSKKNNWNVYYSVSDNSSPIFKDGRYGVIFDAKFNPIEARVFMGSKMIGVVTFEPTSETRIYPSYLIVKDFNIEDAKYKNKHSVSHIIETILDEDRHHKGVVLKCDNTPREVNLCMQMKGYNKIDNYYIIKKDYGSDI